jgi:hypothetical protein
MTRNSVKETGKSIVPAPCQLAGNEFCLRSANHKPCVSRAGDE